MLNKYRLEIKWGLIFTLMLLLWLAGEKLLGYHDAKIDQHMIVTNLVMIPAFAIYYFALKEKREQLGDYITWKEAFVSGVIIAVVVMLLAPLNQYIISTFITPDYFKNMIAYSVEHGHYDSVEAAADNFNLQSYIIQSAIGAILMGTITAAIMALVVQKKKP